MPLVRWWLAAWIVCCAAAPAQASESAGGPSNADEAGAEFFERKIRPLLSQHCSACHGRGRNKGGLSLESRTALLAGGDSGAAVVLGKPDEGLLIEAVGYAGDVQMPPNGKLAAEEIAALKQWLALGAPWPVEPTGG
ncbi:MAG TPA: c-type cytochrome domain-containing protein, partial [Pirellulales bacterium]|nr:c-type cytochrome domain-containing protein [Pirellulales bacterium]